MALSVTPQASPLAARLVEETAANATARNNVTGAAGVLYSIDVDNPNAAAVYLKIYDNAAPTVGTTPADWVFRIAATTRRALVFHAGLAFNALSFAVVTGAAEANAASPAVGVVVRMSTS